MIYSDFETNKSHKVLFNNSYDFNKFSNTKDFSYIDYVVLSVKGSTYTERRNNLKSLATDCSFLILENVDKNELSNAGIDKIKDWFTKVGKQFGLMREFKNLGVI